MFDSPFSDEEEPYWEPIDEPKETDNPPLEFDTPEFEWVDIALEEPSTLRSSYEGYCPQYSIA